MKKTENWKTWYPKNKEKLIIRFVNFIKKHRVGDMDLETFCRYEFFKYQNKEQLVKTYTEDTNIEGKRLKEVFATEEHFRMSVFASVEDFVFVAMDGRVA